MTPMQSLKNSFDRFKAMLPAKVRETALNKSSPRVHVSSFCGDREEHVSKGVRSDFIKHFKWSQGGVSKSLGFAFAYRDLDPKDFSVQVSLKLGESFPEYWSGPKMEVERFRELFERAMDRLEAMESPGFDQMAQAFCETFELKRGRVSAKKAVARQKRRALGG